MSSAARGMKAAGLTFDLVLTSPLLRARQTARIVMARLRPRPTLQSCPELAPGTQPDGVIKRLSQVPPSGSILLVGHEPGLSSLASLLLLGRGRDLPLEFKKGGLCRIDFPGPPLPGAGRLIYHLTPRILRRLGNRSLE